MSLSMGTGLVTKFALASGSQRTAWGQMDSGTDAEALVEAGELDAAIALLRQDSSRSGSQSKYLAWLELRRGDYPGSMATLEELLTRDPRDDEARLSLGFAQWYSGDLAAAAETIARIDQQDPSVDAGLAARARAEQDRLSGEVQEMRVLAAQQDSLDALFAGMIAFVVALSLAAILGAARRSSFG